MFVQFKGIKIRLQLLCLLNILSKLAYSFCAKNCYCQYFSWRYFYHNTHTHTRLTALFPELPRWAGTRKVKPIWILLKQETVTWQWRQVCTLLQTDNHATHHNSVFLQAGCPSCCPTNSVKTLKADVFTVTVLILCNFSHSCTSAIGNDLYINLLKHLQLYYHLTWLNWLTLGQR